MRLFAALRERAGSRSVELELPDGAVVGDVWGELAFGDEPEGLLYAVNRDYAEKSAKLSPDDEVAVIPPVSGGDFRLSETPLSIEAVVSEVRTRRGRRDRDLRRARPGLARAVARSSISSTRPTRAWPSRSWPSWPSR